MSKIQKFFFYLLLCMTLLLTILFVFLLRKTNSSVQTQTSGKITAILNTENLFWQNIWNALREESTAENFSLSEYQISSTESISDYLEIALLTNPKAIIFNPSTIHDDESRELLVQAHAQDICLIALDSPYPALPSIHLGIDNVADSEKIANYIIKHITNEKIVFLKYRNTLSTTLLTRMETMQSLLKEQGYSDSVIELELPTGEIARQETLLQYFNSCTDPVFIVGCGPQQTLTAAKALSAANTKKKIRILGFGESDEAIEFLKNNLIEAMLIQNNEQMGRLAIRSIAEFKEGTTPSSDSIYVESSLYTSNTANSIFR